MNKINIGLLSIITATSLYAQEIPNIGTILKEVTPLKIEKKKELLPPLEQTKEFETSYKDGQKVHVERFLISGATHMSNEELKTIVQPYERKMLSFKDMQEVASLITQAYKAKGYFVAQAYIPLQNLKKQKGVLKIEVIEGEYGEFHLENSSLVHDSILQAKLDRAKNSPVISEKSLQRTLLLINESNGAKVSKTQIKPGQEVGTSDFIIGVDTTSKYNGYVVVDNYGSQYTGKHRIMAGIDINSPFGIGDKISLSGLSSEDLELSNGRIAYDFPLNNDGLKGQVSYSKTTYELGSSYANLDALGYSDSIVAKVSYPYILTSNEKLLGYFQTAYNTMHDEIQSTDTKIKKNIIAGTMGVEYIKDTMLFDQYNQTNVNISLTMGRLHFNYDEDKQNDENGANTNGRFSKVNIELEQKTYINQNFQWNYALKLQYALGDKNLDGSEDMSVGGINGVKFYQDGEESAENGYIFSTELLYSLPQVYNVNSQVGIFYDNGRVYMSKDTTNEKNRILQDIGLSYSGTYKNLFLKSYLAYKVGNAQVTSQDSYGSRMMVQAGVIF